MQINNLSPGGQMFVMPTDLLNLIENKLSELEVSNSPSMSIPGYKQWNILDNPEPAPTEDKSIQDLQVLIPGLEPVVDYFKQYVNAIYRFRLSILEPGHDIDWHVAHRLPRIHIPLSKVRSTFYIKFKDKMETLQLEYGNAYMVNVAYPHMVKIDDSGVRRNAFFSFDRFITNDLNKQFYYRGH